MNKKEIGKAGENMAEVYLEQNGYRILCRNYWCKRGEIDLVAQKGNCVRFVEVKTRTDDYYGKASECVNGQKLRRMSAAAESYMKAAAGMPGLGKDMQLDLIEVSINHIENIG